MSYEITDIESHGVAATLGVLNSTGDSRNRYLDNPRSVSEIPALDNYRRVFAATASSSLHRCRSDRRRPPPRSRSVCGWRPTRVYRAAADRLIRIKTNQQVKAAARDQSPDFSSEESYVHTGKPAQTHIRRSEVDEAGSRMVGRFQEVPGPALVLRAGQRPGG